MLQLIITWVYRAFPLHGIASGVTARCNSAANICQGGFALWRAELRELIALQARCVNRHGVEKGRAVGDSRIERCGAGVADVLPIRACEPVEGLRLAQCQCRSENKVKSKHLDGVE